MTKAPKAKHRMPMRERPAQKRICDFEEVPLGYSPEEAQKEASRCLQCRNPVCMTGCPVHIKIPEFIKCVAERDFLSAAKKIKETHNFPAICGRVCPQEEQCEKECVLARKQDPIAIGHLERFVADWEASNATTQIPKNIVKNGKKVAVVGSGPAGLVTAGELAKAGFDVTIFEALHKTGGVLMYGIPEFRLPKVIVEREINDLKKLGVVIEKNFIVGKVDTVDELLQDGFDAVFIGSGAGAPMFLNIPGEHHIGVYSANEYLTRSNLMKAYLPNARTPIIRGKVVVTVGGGNVAMDSARTALRLGAEKSIIVYRRTEREMPARIDEIEHTKAENIDFKVLCNPIEILADEDGQVSSVRCIRMMLGEPDASGRRRPITIPNSEFTIDCDVVIVAIGNRPNPLIQSTTPDMEVSDRGTIVADRNTGRTSKPYVYAGGDVVTGAATVILAMGAGKVAARSIMEDLLGNEKWVSSRKTR